MGKLLVLLGLGILVGILSLWRAYSAGKRTRALAALAAARGFSFAATAAPMSVIPSGQLNLFRKGDSRRITNLMWQKTGERLWSHFDLTYVSGYKDHETREQTQTVTMFQTSQVNFPGFQLAAKDLIDKISRIFDGPNIHFESSPHFSNSYLLKGKDEPAIRALFDENTVLYFETHPGYSVEAFGDALIVYHAGQLLKLQDTEREMMNRDEIFQLLANNAKK